VLRQCGVLKGSDVELYVDPTTHNMSKWSWNEFGVFERRIILQNYIKNSRTHEAITLDDVPNEIEISGAREEVEGYIACSVRSWKV
jgi:hypothetical protein